MNLGNALMERHELKEAIAEFRRAITLKPDFPMAHYNLGNALDEDGKTSEAISEYGLAIERATEFNLGFPQAHYNLGAALLKERQTDRAITEFRRASNKMLATPPPTTTLALRTCRRVNWTEPPMSSDWPLRLINPASPTHTSILGLTSPKRVTSKVRAGIPQGDTDQT